MDQTAGEKRRTNHVAGFFDHPAALPKRPESTRDQIYSHDFVAPPDSLALDE
jgi:hypothetical protein